MNITLNLDFNQKQKYNLVIALDQATQKTGMSIWDKDNKELLGYTLITYTKGKAIDRIKYLKDEILDYINNLKQYAVNIEVVIEDIQYQDDKEEENKLTFGNIKSNITSEKINNVKTFKVLAWLQGVLLVSFKELDIPVTTIFSSTWKSYCKIRGACREVQKQNSINFAKEKFNINNLSSDEADAICLGWTYVSSL